MHDLTADTGGMREEEESGNRLFALSGSEMRTKNTGAVLGHVRIEMRECKDIAAAVLAEQIGRFEPLNTPFGVKPLVYADWTASARSLRHIEAFLSRQVLPYYGNTHTAASACGAQSSSFVAEARRVVGEFCGARITGKAACDVVLFCGAGTTSAVNQLVSILGMAKAVSPVVLVGPYEHHSNLLPWREAGAAMEIVHQDKEQGVDLADLEKHLLVAQQQNRLVVGAFCAVSAKV